MSVLQDIREQGIRSFVLSETDAVITRVTAGLGWNDIRSMLRDDPPGRPNPRLKPHSEGFWLHMKPAFYHRSVTRFTHTFRLGWLSTFLFLIEIITGVFLMFYYAPTPERAYSDMLAILSNVPFGKLMRDVHRIAAEAMVAVVFFHMVRTYLTASYKRPRQFTWLTGGILLVLTLGLSYTGYLLPWDQLAFWAVTIGASMVEAAPPPIVGKLANLILKGAPDIGAAGLLRFYLLHVILLPLVALVFIGVHYYKVVHHGHSLPASEEEVGEDSGKRVPADRRVYFMPNVMVDELMLAAVVTLAFIAITAFIYGAPLEHKANPLSTPFHTTAPWYFLWIQGLLKLGDKMLLGVILPGVVVVLILIVPYIDFSRSRRGGHRRPAILVGLLFIFALVVLSWMGTPNFGVTGVAAQEVVQEFIPEEGASRFLSLPFDQLEPGVYDTVALPDGMPPRLADMLQQIKNRVESDHELPDGHVVTVIEDWQLDLRKLTMRVLWTGPEGEELDFAKDFYRHRLAIHAE